MTQHTYEQQQRAGYLSYLAGVSALIAPIPHAEPSFWFPRLQQYGAMLSGNAGIWLTQGGVSRQISPVGIGPIWAGFAPVYNLNDGRTSVNGYVIGEAGNDYSGSDDFQWALVNGSGASFFHNQSLARHIPGAWAVKFGGSRIAYLLRVSEHVTRLMVNDAEMARGEILTPCLSHDGAVLVYQIATGTYTRQILSEDGKVLNVRDNEAPIVAFLGPGGQPWLMTGTPDVGTLVYPAFSQDGYQITGDLYYPDARMTERLVSNAIDELDPEAQIGETVENQLRVVGSLNNGALREVWIDFAAPRVDLRLV